jgi:hypothetical protein
MRFRLAALLLLAACAPAERRAAPADTAAARPAQVIDSILPIEEHLRRFRAGLPQVTALEGGLPNDTALVRAFLDAVAARDSASLSRLVLDRAEFGWLYYPAHIYARPPYELDPVTSWMLLQGNSAKGFSRVLREYGGSRLEYLTHGCSPASTLEPPAQEWNQCEVAFRRDGEQLTKRIFGSVVRIGDRYKFVSFANDL